MARPNGVMLENVYYGISKDDTTFTLKKRHDAAVARGDQYSPKVIKAKLNALLESQKPTATHAPTK